MIEKRIDQIDAADLQRLVDNAVSEGRTIEYKEALPGNADGDKKEFLADVSSFANAVGGDLIFGIAEARENGKPTGIAGSAPGLAASGEPDLLRLENLMRDGISPRLQGVQLRTIPGLSNGPAVVIRIPQSWSGPHVVSFQQWSRFYSRNGGGKYLLDVFELRDAFTASANVAERIRAFTAGRIGRIVAGDLPVPFDDRHVIVLHAIPISALARPSQIDLLKIANAPEVQAPLYSDSFSHHFNLDGLITFAPTGNGMNYSYMQVFRNGAIETATTAFFYELRSGETQLSPSDLGRELIRFIARLSSLWELVELSAPAVLAVTLTGTAGVSLGLPPRIGMRNVVHPFTKDVVALPETLVPELGAPAEQLVRPLLDTLWQAAGLPRCFDYTDAGEWKPQS